MSVVAALALALFSGCSDTKTTSPETVAPTDSTTPATDPPTTPAPTTVAPTLAPTTTAAPLPFLRSDGLGPFNFGASDTDMVAGTSLTVISDESRDYPTGFGDGFLLSTAGDYLFQYASGRSVCWNDGVANYLCAYFGGADSTHLGLVGWDYFTVLGTPSPVVGPFTSASGATINALVSSIAGVPPIAGECYGYTNVSVDGIWLDLQVTGDATFGVYGDDGSYTLIVPQPGATVTYLQTGERPQPYSVDGESGDC